MAIFNGDKSGNFITGTDEADTIKGWGGNDTLRGEDGNDTILGQDGADDIDGGRGDDLLEGGSQDDVIFGNEGNDTIRGGPGNDLIDGVFGDAEFLFGQDGNDVMQFNLVDLNGVPPGSDDTILDGGAGRDILNVVSTEPGHEISFTQDGLFFDFTAPPGQNLGINRGIEEFRFSTEETVHFNASRRGATASGEGFFFGAAGDDTFTGVGPEDLFSGGGGRNRYFSSDNDADSFHVAFESELGVRHTVEGRGGRIGFNGPGDPSGDIIQFAQALEGKLTIQERDGRTIFSWSIPNFSGTMTVDNVGLVEGDDYFFL